VNAWRICPPWTIGAVLADLIIEPSAAGCSESPAPRNFNHQFTTRYPKAEVRYIKVRNTRRTCASLLATLGVHPRVATQILRHSEIALTMEVYSEAQQPRREALSGGLGRQPDG